MIFRYAAFLACAVFLGSAVSASADVTGNGPGFVIPDDDAAGATSTITITESETIIDVKVTLVGLTHTWLGDLIATLEGPGGETVELFNQVGRTGLGQGDSSDFNGDYEFYDSGSVDFTPQPPGDLWTVAASIGAVDVVPSAGYFPTGPWDGVSTGIVTSLIGTFINLGTAGDWTLTISDNSFDDFGSLGSWQLDIISVPEPGTYGLLAVAGLGFIAWRRRQR